MSIPNDEYFVKALESTWCGLQETAETAVGSGGVMNLIGLMRQRLITLSNNHQEEYQLRNLFRKFDSDGSGAITPFELKGMLAHLGVLAEEKEVLAVMRELDLNKSGSLEFEEFNHFLLVDPYTKIKF